MIDEDELARFGLQIGGAFDETLISSKWEAAAFVSALDDDHPNGEPATVIHMPSSGSSAET